MQLARTSLAALLVLVLTAITGGPALAGGGGPVTDMWVGRYDAVNDLVLGSVGDNVQSVSPENQRKTIKVKPGGKARFAIYTQNDGSTGTINCGVFAFPTSSKFKAKITDGLATDVTAAWIDASHSDNIGTGLGVWHYLTISVSKRAKPGTTRAFELICTAAVTISQDSVSAQVVVK